MASRAEWAARKLEDVRQRISQVEAQPAGTKWNAKANKERVLTALRNEEATYRRMLPAPDDGYEDPF